MRLSAWGLAWVLALGSGAAQGAVAQPAQVAQDAGATPAVAFSDARSKADAILRQREFRRVQQISIVDQQMSRLERWMGRFFSRAFGFLPHSTWLAKALEWGVPMLAAIALLLWAWRVNQLQRLAISDARSAVTEVWQRESDNWAERARTEAGREDWREAVHCLYWSAIVLLEGQKLWRQNRARTPREYLVLLPPGSAKQQSLSSLTQVFERIWYGLRPAAESDYRQAAAMLEHLRAR